MSRVSAGSGSDTREDLPLALIAGAGDIPLVVARALAGRGRPFFVVSVSGEADRDYSAFDHVELPMGAIGRLVEQLNLHGSRQVMFLGQFHRPRFSQIEWDRGAVRFLSRIMKMRFGGDDAVIGGIVGAFEGEGFSVVGPRDVVPELVSPAGSIGRHRPDRAAREDIAHGRDALSRLGPLDIGQALVVLNRRVIAVEAAEGTTAMIERCAVLRENGRVRATAPSGVLVKMLKPGQETRLDMPVIGLDTVRAGAAAGLSGIAVQAGGVLVVDLDAVRRAADEAGLFLFGFDAGTPDRRPR